MNDVAQMKRMIGEIASETLKPLAAAAWQSAERIRRRGTDRRGG